jgi:hypothetical protein
MLLLKMKKPDNRAISLLTLLYPFSGLFASGDLSAVISAGLIFMAVVLVTAAGCAGIGLILIKVLKISNLEQGAVFGPWMLLSIAFNAYLYCSHAPELFFVDFLLMFVTNSLGLGVGLLLLWLIRLKRRQS